MIEFSNQLNQIIDI